MSKKNNRRKISASKEHQVAAALGFIEMVLICLYEKRQKRQVSITIEWLIKTWIMWKWEEHEEEPHFWFMIEAQYIKTNQNSEDINGSKKNGLTWILSSVNILM